MSEFKKVKLKNGVGEYVYPEIDPDDKGGGSGGTNVEPNPFVENYDDVLYGIGIGGVNYSINTPLVVYCNVILGESQEFSPTKATLSYGEVYGAFIAGRSVFIDAKETGTMAIEGSHRFYSIATCHKISSGDITISFYDGDTFLSFTGEPSEFVFSDGK